MDARRNHDALRRCPSPGGRVSDLLLQKNFLLRGGGSGVAQAGLKLMNRRYLKLMSLLLPPSICWGDGCIPQSFI